MNTAFKLGATIVLVPRFEPDVVLDTIAAEGVSIFAGVPAMYAALLAAQTANPREVGSLRECFGGGSALPVELIREVEDRFGCPLYEGYGLSETSPMACVNRPDDALPGSIGTPIWGVEMRIVDGEGNALPPGEVGEVAIRGHCVMTGYLNKPEATAEAITEDGWFLSGDLGRMDEEGRFFIVDRKKELIIRGGENVYPREVEETLHEHPAVAFAAVVGLPDERLGEEVAAVVQLKPGQSVEGEELIDFVKQRLAAYKYPRRVAFVDQLPLGGTGKVLKRQIDLEAAFGTAVGA
jgi:long-chain acyl-CoA synthetase